MVLKLTRFTLGASCVASPQKSSDAASQFCDVASVAIGTDAMRDASSVNQNQHTRNNLK